MATDTGSLYCFATDGRLSKAETTPALTPQVAVPPLSSGLRNVLKEGRIHRGLALVIGRQDTTLAAQIAAATQLQVILLLDDADAVMDARRQLLQQRVAGRGQVSVHLSISGKPLPYADYAFNVIAATGAVAGKHAAELRRVLQPSGGILYVDEATVDVAKQVEADLQRDSERDKPTAAPSRDATRRVGKALVFRRGKLSRRSGLGLRNEDRSTCEVAA